MKKDHHIELIVKVFQHQVNTGDGCLCLHQLSLHRHVTTTALWTRL